MRLLLALLQGDLIRLCSQIGVYPDEIPRLVTNKFQMLNILTSQDKYYPQSGFGQSELRFLKDSIAGRCFRSLRLIYIQIDENKKNFDYDDLYNTLAHELVHYRFPELNYGSEKPNHNQKFKKKLNLVLKGERFELKRLYPYSIS